LTDPLPQKKKKKKLQKGVHKKRNLKLVGA
jgi:hypothetical protein